ncbi:MAG: hypothetical protein RL189_860 [Pseudomonadota bacterium]
MKSPRTSLFVFLSLAATACGSTSIKDPHISIPPANSNPAAPAPEIKEEELDLASGQFQTTIQHNGVSVKLVINKPTTPSADVMMTFHGTVETDDKIVASAQKTLDETKKMISRTNVLYISVAYPEENLLMGDNLKHAEAALLWVKQKANSALRIKTERIFLLGHSQGGYLVTRLNNLHSTDGVIANAPGPLNFKLRCELEESGQIPASGNCQRMKAKYGSTKDNPNAYLERSLISHLTGFKSRILFTQGMSDAKIQLTSWPVLKEKVKACKNCAESEFIELDGKHPALFDNSKGPEIINSFIK